MEIVILGSGRLGARFASLAAPMGHRIRIVDNDDTKFKNLENHPNIEPVKGNIFNEELDETIFSKTSRAVDIFIVLTGSDNINLMIAQGLQQKFHIPRVLIRVFDPTLAAVYRGLGMEIICPTDSAVQELLILLKGKG